jgi:hypothetical protein
MTTLVCRAAEEPIADRPLDRWVIQDDLELFGNPARSGGEADAGRRDAGRRDAQAARLTRVGGTLRRRG